MVVYDITDKQSLVDVEMWLQEADKHGGPNLTKLLIGNKCDKNNDRQVSFSEGKNFADSMGMYFIETSALAKINIDEAFKIMANDLLQKNCHLTTNNEGNVNSLNSRKQKDEKKKCC